MKYDKSEKFANQEAFIPVEANPDFVAMEKRILKWWYSAGIVKKYLKKNKNSSKRFSFIDGPITANNPMGVHHAWGRTYKDVWQRYFNMKGYAQRFQNGFDCQGLWVEVEVEKDLGFKTKKDIEKLGLAKFSEACRRRVAKYSRVQTEQSIRLGQFMDWDNSYYTFTDTNIEYIWYFLKKCYEKGWLYKGFRPLPWCARCGTSLSEHELYDSYRQMAHRSVYLKFPLSKEKETAFLVWTTAPWTLPANVALAVHPDFEYAKAKTDGDTLIVAKNLLSLIKNKYRILAVLKGKDMVGWKFDSPFAELPCQKKTQKRVVLWPEVSDKEGTGIVHIAPGCGEEDFELGRKEKLDVLVPLNEDGVYVEGYGEFTGKFAGVVADQVFASLKEKGLLYQLTDITHSYPVCWRCKEPIVFRAEENWFISSKEIRPKMKHEAKKVKWYPEYVGKLMQDWLTNMGDWNISRKRYFGLPLPFYECQCGYLTIISSKQELRKMALEPRLVDNLKELHRPWIDEIKISCPKCHRPVSRISDVGDCWLDAGIVPFSTLKYLTDKKYWRQWFPADWISEMREQIRLWFYSMLFMSVTLEDRTPYLSVMSYEKMYDEKGKPMHKSAGNAIWFDEAADKMGADVMRWMYCRQPTDDNLLFGFNIANETRRRFFLVLWNVYKFFVTYANIDGFSWNQMRRKEASWWRAGWVKSGDILDRWILSRMNGLIGEVTEYLDHYNAYSATEKVEEFVNDLSTWYLRRSRERMGPTASDEADKKCAYQTLYVVLTTLTKLLAPFVPFLAEGIYQNLKCGQKMFSTPASVHLEDWPKADKRIIDRKLEEQMALVRKICELGHAARKKEKIKVRQPLKKLMVAGGGAKTVLADSKWLGAFVALIRDELNVKEIEWKASKGELAVRFDLKITPDLEAEGEARELVRQIQDLRKKAGCRLNQKITVYLPQIPADEKLVEYIKRETLAAELVSGKELKISF